MRIVMFVGSPVEDEDKEVKYWYTFTSLYLQKKNKRQIHYRNFIMPPCPPPPQTHTGGETLFLPCLSITLLLALPSDYSTKFNETLGHDM